MRLRLVLVSLALLAGCGDEASPSPAAPEAERVPLGPGVSEGTIVARGLDAQGSFAIAAGFSLPLEEEVAEGAVAARTLGTLCLFVHRGGRAGGGGCGGFKDSAAIHDEGCGDTRVFGLAPEGGRAVVEYEDGESQIARLFPTPRDIGFGREVFVAVRRGAHTVAEVRILDADGRISWRQRVGEDDVIVSCE